MTEYRPLRREDQPALTRVVYDTWNMAALCGGVQAGLRASALYLEGCLAQSSFAQVAVLDSRAVGVVCARLEGAARLRLPDGWPDTVRYDPQSNKLLPNMERYEAACAGLLRESGHSFGGELTLLAVQPDQRGRGIGAALYTAAQDLLRAGGAYFLYTDSQCSYTFYDAHGMQRLGQTDMVMPDGRTRLTVFLYGEDGGTI